ncbi:MAG: UDP-3-O-(3-hydroxymyristoyl)glucosamine N-acyltransferase [Pseudomonadota bacterium]
MPIDPRFYASEGAVTLKRWAELGDAELIGDPNVEVTGIASASDAAPGEVCFFEGRMKDMSSISAASSACLIKPELAEHLPDGVAGLVHEYPRLVHAEVSETLFQRLRLDAGAPPIHPMAAVDDTVVMEPGVVIGAGASIGEGARLGAYCVIGPGVQIGRGCDIGAHTSVQCALIGDHVKLAAGVRVGETGFGVIGGPYGAEDQPHFGRVILQDHVTVGANTTIDRGVFGDTVVGERSRMDNLCQIAHNVQIGRSVVIAAYGGISGSVTIGDGAQLGGRAGVADHVRIGVGSLLAAGSGVFRDIPDGETWGGTPARPIRDYMRETAWVAKATRERKSKP